MPAFIQPWSANPGQLYSTKRDSNSWAATSQSGVVLEIKEHWSIRIVAEFSAVVPTIFVHPV